MIAKLRGIVEFKDHENCVLDVSGVGYELACSLATLEELALGESTTLEAYTHVREDQISLFGFRTRSEKNFFLSLLSVTGIGPKLAIKILSAGSVPAIARLIESGDVKALSQLPKVGKKTAEQLVVTLRGKLAEYFDIDTAQSARGNSLIRESGASAPLAIPTSIESEIGSALAHLGFRPQEVERALARLKENLLKENLSDQGFAAGNTVSLEEGVRFALQHLSR